MAQQKTPKRKRTNAIQVRLTDRELEKLREASAKYELGTSELIRLWIEQNT